MDKQQQLTIQHIPDIALTPLQLAHELHTSDKESELQDVYDASSSDQRRERTN